MLIDTPAASATSWIFAIIASPGFVDRFRSAALLKRFDRLYAQGTLARNVFVLDYN
ncbi:hypothetical protein [Microbacterium azadirachtae]|uniref:hypothetical protein n=1 Tax=Microbacterium azadirachtae TaxID=582680 RepID=UPI0019108A9B|nr:hypothetical protein [Microbacterium azadirachtae]